MVDKICERGEHDWQKHDVLEFSYYCDKCGLRKKKGMTTDKTELDDIAERIADQLHYENVIVVAQREAEHEIRRGDNRGREDTLTSYIGLLEVAKDAWQHHHWRGNDQTGDDDGGLGGIIPGGDE